MEIVSTSNSSQDALIPLNAKPLCVAQRKNHQMDRTSSSSYQNTKRLLQDIGSHALLDIHNDHSAFIHQRNPLGRLTRITTKHHKSTQPKILRFNTPSTHVPKNQVAKKDLVNQR